MIKIFISKIQSRITSEMFIKYIASNYLGISQQKLDIKKNEYGKPFLANFPSIHYNVSHTKGLIVCAISDRCIGIDVEKKRTLNKGIVERFFSKSEKHYVFLSEEYQDERFSEIWTKKEAYVKWLGMGMDMPFESFDICDDGNTKKMQSFSYDNYYISVFYEGFGMEIIDECSFSNTDRFPIT